MRTVADRDKVIGKLRALHARYLRIYWHDYTSSAKCRVVPIARVYASLAESDDYRISITKASLGLLPNDFTIPGVTGTGSYFLGVDWASLKKGPALGHVSCYAFFLDENSNEVALCPRTILSNALSNASASNLHFLVGFEMEFTVLERTGDPKDKYRMLSHDGHAWSMARALATWGAEGSFNSAADEMLSGLEAAGIEVEQFHPEGVPGQYEIVLPPLPPLEACDTLLHTRQIVESAAARAGFRVTLHPRPFVSAIGNGSHAHISITSKNGDDPEVYERFYGGVLKHFRAIFAFTNCNPTSYERMVDSLWAGGRWITWGTQNKETPLRKVSDSHWEVKVLDGIANPYLAIAALIVAGTHGAELTWKDCEVDPAKLDEEERKALGISERFPSKLEEALHALEDDDVMISLLGREVVERYVGVKEGELALLSPMSDKDRRMWVMERY
ncbi:hypothetical protein GGR57DRAFT_43208 [Xylariaceae sp. FL1272]|nr:hypothetical protein GGR57DRAFT_43208 [Xylariaceae sp. FL1272]